MLDKIINGSSKLSLRIIDWFVTNYSKKNTIILYRKTEKLVACEDSEPENENETVSLKKTKKHKYKTINQDEQFNVYLKYKAQLKAYSKKHFDPFCRRYRFLDHYYWAAKFFQMGT